MIKLLFKLLFGVFTRSTSEVKNFKKLSKDTQREMLKRYVEKN